MGSISDNRATASGVNDDAVATFGNSANGTRAEHDPDVDDRETVREHQDGRGEDQRSKKSATKCRAGLPLFVFNISAMLLFFMIGTVYTGGVIRTIERRFNLRSSQTGFIFSANDITHTMIVVFVGYFGRRANKPKILSATTMFSAIAMLLMASPHWMFPTKSVPTSGYNVSVASWKSPVCSASSAYFNNSEEYGCEDKPAAESDGVPSKPGNTVHPAYYVFVIAQLIGGIGSSGIHSLSLAYIDENAPKAKSSLYVGVVTSMYAFGPVGGFMLSAITLRLPENLNSVPADKPEDPTWIGCWWLGYIICAIGVVLSAIPMWFFPKTMNQTSTSDVRKPLKPTKNEVKPQKCGRLAYIWKEIKGFPRGLLHLLRNKPYLVNLVCIISGAYIIMGVFVNMVRYIEIHFFERAFVASIITALVSALAGAIGGFAGGFVMSRMKLEPAGAMRLIIISTSCFALGILIILFLECPQVEMAGTVHPQRGTLNVLNSCNRQCDCPSDRQSYIPVCGSDNLTYFSGCFAGCTSYSNGTYNNCSCIGYDGVSPDESAKFDAGSARQGFCVPYCKLLIPYAAVTFVMSIVGSMARVPFTIVNFRIVDDDERSFALAFNSFIINLLGFIPAPLLFGRLIDSSCRLWQRTAALPDCQSSVGETGSCLLYDTAKFRQRIYGVALGFELLDLLFIFILYWLIRHRKFSHNDETAIGGDDVTDEERRQLTDSNGNNSKPIAKNSIDHRQPNNVNSDDADHIRETVIDF